ncbi:hypothetical protein, partial [Rhodovulum steppense]|uniref:hypothetical protein n=1 Tax=Rhodovulum steppense TaxID=540251 RepID=UPI001A9D5711
MKAVKPMPKARHSRSFVPIWAAFFKALDSPEIHSDRYIGDCEMFKVQAELRARRFGCAEPIARCGEPSMKDVCTIGVDLAKNVFQLQCVDAEGLNLPGFAGGRFVQRVRRPYRWSRVVQGGAVRP